MRSWQKSPTDTPAVVPRTVPTSLLSARPAEEAAQPKQLAMAPLFPLTRRGLLFLIASVLMIALGLARKDLAALFWGSSFLVILAYSLLGNTIHRFVLKNRLDVAGLELRLPARGVFPGDPVEAGITADLPLPLIPGFSFCFLSVLTWRDRKPLVLRQSLTPGENRKTIVFRPQERGHYRSRTAYLVAQDYFGFTSGWLSAAADESLIVYPGQMPTEELRLRMAGGEAREHLEKKQKTDELLEVRKYFPGDDARKLNWKVFAHIGELFIRRKEEAPPPASNLLFVFDSSRPAALPKAIAQAYLDLLVELACSIIMLMLKQNTSVMFTSQEQGRIASLEKEKRHELLALLSSIWWTDGSQRPALPERDNLVVVLFSSPGSPCLPSIVESVKRRKWKTTLIFRALDFFESGQESDERFSLKRLLFVGTPRRKTNLPLGSSTSAAVCLSRPRLSRPRRNSGTPSRHIERQMANLKELLLSEMVKYSAAPWKLADVRAI